MADAQRTHDNAPGARVNHGCPCCRDSDRSGHRLPPEHGYITPAVFIVVFALAPAGAEDPTLNGIRLYSTCGTLASAPGRLGCGLSALALTTLGIVCGTRTAAHLGTDASAAWVPSIASSRV
jgi:hypothetical protein